jgi:hypothetical protein
MLDRVLRSLLSVISCPAAGRHGEILECFLALVPNYMPSRNGLGRVLPETGQALRPVLPQAGEADLSFIA